MYMCMHMNVYVGMLLYHVHGLHVHGLNVHAHSCALHCDIPYYIRVLSPCLPSPLVPLISLPCPPPSPTLALLEG